MATETNPIADMTRMMQEFKIPGFDMAPIIESRRKDMAALVEASEAAQLAMQALVRRQTEIVTEAMAGIQESAKALGAGGAHASDPGRQAALLNDAYQKSLADMKELAEMARKSQVDAMAIITKRGTESLAETRKLMQAG
ncbi:TIGR01841 family phasin [Paraburkholderia sp. RL17-383-BIF-A]|jgi:phasin family protein|uniref:TIGR01841 family phasin n=1 Tax=Burkholderiaceae TaxID=119060 RepID=UPI0008955A9D|nr:TIGR01841 family phasin [Burkholderia sp. WP9]SEE89054.1 phasin family protein [Burkholderia sp. WP9]